MNGAHLHLIVNHVPVVLAPLGFVILALGALRRNEEYLKIGLGLLVAAALVTIPAYFTGESAADVIGRLGAVSPDAIERHDEAATGAFAAIGLAGLAGLVGLILIRRKGRMPRWIVPVALILALGASAWLGVTANLGGQIRHTEIRGVP
jgi:uncharacterized membrane protein